jgi:hypothetical protein
VAGSAQLQAPRHGHLGHLPLATATLAHPGDCYPAEHSRHRAAMIRRLTLLILLAGIAVLAACQADQESVGATPTRAATGGTAKSTPALDACPTWLAEVKSLCSDFVDGRAVTADCSRHALTLQVTWNQPSMSNPQVAPSVCDKHLATLRNDRATLPTSPAVRYGEACTAFAAKVKASCVDGLGSNDDFQTCNAKLGMIGSARDADDQGEGSCTIGLAVY